MSLTYMVTYGSIWLNGAPSSAEHADGRIFWKANKATLPFLSFAGLCFGVRLIWSPAMEADSLSLVRRPSKVSTFNSADGGGEKHKTKEGKS